ncbi:MAG: hypothetical protein MUO67_00420 [Anaerolineales bacterium]|nr:hypothetical protein [Anaerolineales bacterium]
MKSSRLPIAAPPAASICRAALLGHHKWIISAAGKRRPGGWGAAHKIRHVIARQGAQHITQQELTSGMTGAVILSTYNPQNPRSMATAQVANRIGNLVTIKSGRGDELDLTFWGCLMHQAGYDERQILEVLRILDEAS